MYHGLHKMLSSTVFLLFIYQIDAAFMSITNKYK